MRALLDNIEFGGVVVSAPPLPGILLPDVSDLPFLEVAAAGSANYLITGNGVHFAPVKGHHSIEVISPRQYIELLAGGESP
ncbi:MAG: PIN domain-containing protein [Gemmatimonadaceae bacterium]|nr:PIN domain-containing protein [Gemmatimonadaceae bacterium]